MPRRAHVNDTIYLDDAEGFILEHALISPPRTWPPLPPTTQHTRLTSVRRKVDWSEEMKNNPEQPVVVPPRQDVEEDKEGDKERCVICLMGLRDRTVAGVCGHEFCFECIGVWSNQSRRCPLCSADMAPFLLHDLDNSTPTKFYLPPLPSKRQATLTIPNRAGPSRISLPEERERVEEVQEEPDELDLQIARRREIYTYGLFAKHIGSNPTTQFRANPSPREIADSPQLIQRATTFLRRELRVWSDVPNLTGKSTGTGRASGGEGIDVEYLTMYVISLLKAIDIRSEPAIRLLADFLDPPSTSTSTSQTVTASSAAPTPPLVGINPPLGRGLSGNGNGNVAGVGIRALPDFPHAAEHFAHELYTFLRSPFKELWKWDEVVQYEPIPSEKPRSPSPAVVTADIPPSKSAARPRSRSPSPYSDYSSFRSESYSDRSYSLSPSRSPPTHRRRSRSRSRSPPPRRGSPRDPSRRDTFIAPPSPGGKRWDEADTWIDPEYAAWLEDERERERERRERKRRKSMPDERQLRDRIELLPSPPARTLAMDELLTRDHLSRTEVSDGSAPAMTLESTAINGPIISIRGAAAAPVKLTLAERLAKAKAEAAAANAQTDAMPPQSTTPPTAPPLPHSVSDPTQTTMSKPGVRAAVQARLKLRLKLASEKKTFVYNQNESRAQILRAKILEAKAAREAEETDMILRQMDKIDRAKEVRRRLMALKMMAAETESETRARELKERLIKDKRARVLREQLLQRKKSLNKGVEGVERVAVAV